SSNALVAACLPRTLSTGRRQALLEYRRSLEATFELDVEIVYGGHGEPIEDHRQLIAKRLTLHDERARAIEGLLGGGAKTAHELAADVWGRLAITRPYLTLSEILGHLDLLAARDVVLEYEDDWVVRFELRDGPAH